MLCRLSLERIGRAQHGKIGAVIGLLDAAIRKMLDLQADVEPVAEHLSDADMVAELEVSGKLAV